MNRDTGFTLIELLLVLAILGIIAAIAIPALLGQLKGAYRTTTVATAHDVAAEAASAGVGKADATAAMDYVVTMPNFQFPKCKNPYAPTMSALNGVAGAPAAGAAAGNGQVGMVAAEGADAFGNSTPSIAVSFKHTGVSSSTVYRNVPLLH